MRPLRILVADDHEVMRTGVRALIEHEPGWQVCGTATNGQEAVETAKKLKPEVVVLDMTMPELDGLEALRQIKHALPNTEVVIFSAYHSEEVIEQLFDAGAKSYIQNRMPAGIWCRRSNRSPNIRRFSRPQFLRFFSQNFSPLLQGKSKTGRNIP